MVMGNCYKWILLGHEGHIAGFYYEKEKSGMAIMRLGIIGDNVSPRDAPLQPQYHNCVFPSPIGGPNTGFFISSAVLYGLERVDICRVKNRCTGLMVYYLDGSTSILGQWHASSASQSSCIYDSKESAATDIYFEMSRYGSREIVTAVSFTPFTTEMHLDAGYRVFSIGEVRQNNALIRNID